MSRNFHIFINPAGIFFRFFGYGLAFFKSDKILKEKAEIKIVKPMSKEKYKEIDREQKHVKPRFWDRI